MGKSPSSSTVTLFVSTKSYAKRPASGSLVPKVREPTKAGSLAWVRSQGPPGVPVEEQTAVPRSSGFGIPSAVLPEEIPLATELLFMQIPAVEPTTDVLAPEPPAPTVAAYRHPPPVKTPLKDEDWIETQEDMLESITAWRPLKEVSQEDLDQRPYLHQWPRRKL